ncbi:hypothetical protein O7626_39475 [Micromonospora sp. WMMD1102]|uniref:hypothetical protein n=1 Tax=Micromonospora sp. WMMD1102 TaxID=3016105 RepID=UPI00241585BC|nr:hypothetical protein [Micromonospora sp. WMMD1102]MDG4791897.1 hypothetical protein [Micromonospora sp. WMMD1102]
MTVKTSAQLTRERREFSGLDSIADELVEQPRGTRYAVVAYDVKRVSDEIAEGGEKIPTVQFTHIEPVRGDLEATVKRILAERYKDRTGKDLDGDPALFDVVPEAGAEELLAERAEAQAAQDGQP